MSGAFAREFGDAEPLASQPIPIRPPVQAPGEYPIQALSPKLRGAAQAIIDKVQLPEAIAAQAVLAAAALGVQPYIDIILPTGEQIPSSLFLITVASSGERKSSADKLALAAVREREKQMRFDFQEVQANFIADNAAFQAARKKAVTGSKSRDQIRADLDACGEEPIAPPQPLLISDEGTLQGLQKLFAEAMPSLGLFSDEGGQWLGGHSMQDDNRVATGAALSKLWDGAPIKRVRGTDGFTILSGRRLSLHLMIQELIAKKLFGDKGLESQGLLSRMLVCSPLSRKGERKWREASTDSDQALKEYGNRLFGLLSAGMPMDATTRELTPRTVTLSAEAREMFIGWHDSVELELKKGGKFERISGFAAKLPEHSVRVAAVMAYFEDRKITEISGDALASGIALANFYAAEAIRLFGIGSVSEETDNAASIIEWVRDESLNIVGRRFLGRYGPGRKMDGAVRERAIALLIDMKHLVPIAGGAEVSFNGKVEFNREAYTVAADEPEGGQ